MINQQSKEIPKFEYIHQEDIGRSVFDIIRLKEGGLLFSYQDKHGIFNVFPTMGDFILYIGGDINACQRVCIDNEYI